MKTVDLELDLIEHLPDRVGLFFFFLHRVEVKIAKATRVLCLSAGPLLECLGLFKFLHEFLVLFPSFLGL